MLNFDYLRFKINIVESLYTHIKKYNYNNFIKLTLFIIGVMFILKQIFIIKVTFILKRVNIYKCYSLHV